MRGQFYALIPFIAFILLSSAISLISHERKDEETSSSKATQTEVALQISGEIRGTVTDESGAAVPGVRVTLESLTVLRTTTTSVEGRYLFTNIPIGSNYQIRFSLIGFGQVVRRGIRVTQNDTTRVDVRLERGPTPSPTILPSPVPSLTPTPEPPPTPQPSPSRAPTRTPHPSPTGAATPPPEASPRPTPMASPSASPHGQDWDVIVGNEVQKLRDSTIVFNPPLKMRQGQTERIEARISSEDIGSTLREGLKGRGEPQAVNIKVSQFMKVVLTGDQDAFVIQKFGSEEQTVAGKPFAQWEWDVTPLQSGNHSLHLQVTATISIPGRGEKAYDIPVMHRQIEVQIDPWYVSKRFVGENWQWLWTTLLIPVGAWLWNKRRKKRRRARVT